MTRTQLHLLAAALRLAPIGAITGCGADDLREADSTQSTHSAALNAVPSPDEPGHGALERVFVGLADDGALAVSVASTADGRLLAYACDGERVGIWLEGDAPDPSADETRLTAGARQLTLRSASRAPVSDSLRGGIDFVVMAQVGGEERLVTMRAANPTAGMYRYTESDGDVTYTAGWVVLNDGRVFGVDDGAGAVKSREIVAGEGLDGPIASPSEVGGVDAEEAILNRFRCGRLLLQINRAMAQLGGAIPSSSPFGMSARQKYRELECAEHGFPDFLAE